MAKKFILTALFILLINSSTFAADPAPASTAGEIGGAFELTNQDGKKVTNKDFAGKKLLVYFGFTNCPDICPVSMAIITEVMNQLQTANVKNVQPIFISVDPERDTPAVLKKYLKDYYPSFVALTGPKDEVEKVEKEYKVYAEKAAAKASDKGYNVGHSDLIYYMDENGKYIYHFNSTNAAEDIVDYITKH